MVISIIFIMFLFIIAKVIIILLHEHILKNDENENDYSYLLTCRPEENPPLNPLNPVKETLLGDWTY